MSEQNKEMLRLEELRRRQLRSEELLLARANKHLAGMEEKIHRQREHIRLRKAQGHPTNLHEATLSSMLETLYVMRWHRDIVLERIDYLTQPIRAGASSLVPTSAWSQLMLRLRTGSHGRYSPDKR